MTDIVIEVGCNRGQDTEKLSRKYGVQVHGFEPVPGWSSTWTSHRSEPVRRALGSTWAMQGA